MLCKKDFKIFLFFVFCIFLNLCGKYIASSLQLPMWFDSLGTVFASYFFGAFCGSIVGITMNIIFSSVYSISIVYGITSVLIAVLVGAATRRKWLESTFGTFSTCFVVTLFSTLISTSISWVLNEGMVGNIWGDELIKFFEEQRTPPLLSSVIAHFYLEFVDKLFTIFLFHLILRIYKKNIGKIIDFLKFCKPFLKLFSLTFFFMVFLHQNSEAQARFKNLDFNSYVQTLYSSATGLPCGEANDIAQTPDGILWVGTYAGLYRYNGSEFKWMRDFESVRNVNCLYVDEEGRLWIGTNDNGLSICINGKIISTINYDDGLPSNSVRSIVKGADGYYYVGTSIGILVLELNSGLRICNIIEEAGYIADMSADKSGFVSAITSSGELFVLNESEIRFKQKYNADKELYRCCSFDKDGILYVGTSKNQVFKYKISEDGAELIEKTNCAKLSYLNKIYFSEDRTFVCADNGIGYFYGDQNFRIIKTGEFNSSIDNMTIDYQGNYWFTSSRQGLLKISYSPFTDIYGVNGFTKKVVNSVTKLDDVLYVGTDSGLDVIKDGKKISTPLSEKLSGVRIRCLLKDSRNHLWICTYGLGLIEVSPDGGYWVYDSSTGRIGNRIRTVIELKSGVILAAGVGGLSYIRNHTIENVLDYSSGQNGAQTLSLMEMPDGTVLAGTDGEGLIAINNCAISRRIRLDAGLTSDVVLRTVMAPGGKGVFIVTSNSICFLNDEFKISVLKNFPYFNNYDIFLSDDGTMFVLGSAGIYVVDSNSLLSGTFSIQYDILDAKSGLTSSLTANAWNYCDENNKLYLSCGEGVFVVDTKNYSFGKLSYHMMVSSVNLDGVPYKIERSEPLIIKRNTAKIEIFPEVVNYTVLDPLVSYWLEGFETHEIVIPQSQLTSLVYTNLPSRSYTFHMAVFDKDQNVIEQSSYQFIKEQELYDKVFFKIYIVLVAMLAVSGVTWFFVRNQVRHKLEIQKKQVELANEQVRLGNTTILAIAKAVDAKDGNTSQHSVRVSEYSAMIAKELGFSHAECENLRKAALLHDIGKIGIPDRILNKPAKLDDDEYEIMKSHVTRGAEILKDFTMIEHVQEGVLYHHEKYDGSGYPQKLKGESIPLYGRIIGVADAFDAMTANRVYRKQLDFDYVLGELKRCRGSQFDPKIADIMLELIESGKIDVEELYKNSKEKLKGRSAK